MTPDDFDNIFYSKTDEEKKDIEEYLATKQLDLTATINAQEAYRDADFVIISTPTNYDPETNKFDTSSVEAVIRLVKEINPEMKYYNIIGFINNHIKTT